jgi:hypothetical protein
LQRILDFACAAAGLNCESLGARGGICKLPKVRELQRSGGRNRSLFSKIQLRRAAAHALGKNFT